MIVQGFKSLFRNMRGILLALALGAVVSFAIILASSSDTSSAFNEIKNLPRTKEQNLANQEQYSNLTDIYDFNETSAGIDISTWQGAISFEDVKNDGVEFVMIRCGYRKSHTEIEEDDRFTEYMQKAANQGLNIGIYFYSTASSEIEALSEAKWVVEKIKGYKITYPVVYDLENIGEYSTANLSTEQINKNAKVFLDYIANSGYVAGLYSNGYDLNHRWNTNYLKNYLIWYAHYTDEPDYHGNYVMWQYSDKGKIKGISGDVDLNVAYFRYIGD